MTTFNSDIYADPELDVATATKYRTTLRAGYHDLCQQFGHPVKLSAEEGSGVSDAEWRLRTDNGIAVIYNYKTGKNQLGERGLNLDEIPLWCIRESSDEAAHDILAHMMRIRATGKRA